jgi:uncharacterized protein YggE
MKIKLFFITILISTFTVINTQTTISVVPTLPKSVTPDTAFITIKTLFEGTPSLMVQSFASNRVQSVLTLFSSYQIPSSDIRMFPMSINPKYDYSVSPAIIIGY